MIPEPTSIYRVSRMFFLMRIPFLPDILKAVIYMMSNSVIPYQAIIGPRTILAYRGIGVVIHSKSVIGSGCIIGQNVTIGRKRKRDEGPVVGDDVYLAAGCRVLGSVTIGSNSIIGANSVVISDVPPNSIVVGIPGRVVDSLACSMHEYLDI